MNSILLWLGLSLACTVAFLVVLYVVLRNTGEECTREEWLNEHTENIDLNDECWGYYE